MRRSVDSLRGGLLIKDSRSANSCQKNTLSFQMDKNGVLENEMVLALFSIKSRQNSLLFVRRRRYGINNDRIVDSFIIMLS